MTRCLAIPGSFVGTFHKNPGLCWKVQHIWSHYTDGLSAGTFESSAGVPLQTPAVCSLLSKQGGGNEIPIPFVIAQAEYWED